MRVKVYRNLDRPFSLFGIKGRFIALAGALALCIIIVSLVVGSVAGSIVGLAVAAVLLAVGYLAITEIQHRLGNKALRRKMTGLGLPEFVIIRSKVWRRLM